MKSKPRPIKIATLIVLWVILTVFCLSVQAQSVYNIKTGVEKADWNRVPYKANVLPKTRQDASDGWRDVIPYIAPSGMVAVAASRDINVTNDAAYEVFAVLITEAEYAAQLAAAQAQAIAQLAASISNTVGAIQANLVDLGYSLPMDYDSLMPQIVQRSLAGTLTDSQKESKSDLGLLYILLGAGLKEQGVPMTTDAAINAVWQYMQANP